MSYLYTQLITPNLKLGVINWVYKSVINRFHKSVLNFVSKSVLNCMSKVWSTACLKCGQLCV